MPNQEILLILNGLIETSKDGEKGFADAARHAQAPNLRALFSEYAGECRKSVKELQDCVTMLGGTAETSGTISGALHRGWMNLKASVTSDDDLALLEECERGQDHAKARYTEAMKADVTPAVRNLLQRHYEGTLRHHDNIRDLRNRARQTA